MVVYRPERGRPEKLSDNPVKADEATVSGFFAVLSTGDLSAIREYVANYGIKPSVIQPDSGSLAGTTALHYVLGESTDTMSLSRKEALALALIDMGFILDYPDERNVRPIHLAASLGSEKLVNRLIQEGVQVNIRDASGRTPLHRAVTGEQGSCPAKSGGSLGRKETAQSVQGNKKLEELQDAVVDYMSSTNAITVRLSQIHALLEQVASHLPPETLTPLTTALQGLVRRNLDPDATVGPNEVFQLEDRTRSILGQYSDQITRRALGSGMDREYIQLVLP